MPARDVTSWFQDQALSKTLEPVRKFTIGSSDYSGFVMKWPKFRRTSNDIRPKNLTIQLANHNQDLNFFITDKTLLTTSYTIEMGFTHPTSGDELITMFSGKGQTVKYRDNKIDITIVDKFKQLSDRVIGSSDVPVEYLNSNYLPSDIAWWLVTSYGGYDTTTSTANIDIDWDAFAEWASIFSEGSVFVEARFDGQRVNEALRKLGRQTSSNILIQDDKLTFFRWTVADSNTTAFDSSNIKDVELEVVVDDVVNKQFVFADYAPSSDFFQISVVDQDSSSVNSFGIKEHVEEDKNVWHVNTVSALDLAQRRTQVNGEPFNRLKIESGLSGIQRFIGETVTVVDSHLALNEGYRITGMEVDMNVGQINFMADRSQYFGAFTLDVSTLDGPDVLT